MFWHWKRPAQWTCTVPVISAHFPSLWIKQHHIHTLPFNGPFSGTTRVGQYQKGKTTLDFTEARDSEWRWAICKSAPRSIQITTPAPHRSVFTGRMPWLPSNQQRQSTSPEFKTTHILVCLSGTQWQPAGTCSGRRGQTTAAECHDWPPVNWSA